MVFQAVAPARPAQHEEFVTKGRRSIAGEARIAETSQICLPNSRDEIILASIKIVSLIFLKLLVNNTTDALRLSLMQIYAWFISFDKLQYVRQVDPGNHDPCQQLVSRPPNNLYPSNYSDPGPKFGG